MGITNNIINKIFNKFKIQKILKKKKNPIPAKKKKTIKTFIKFKRNKLIIYLLLSKGSSLSEIISSISKSRSISSQYSGELRSI
jgi:hypothetical protein